MRGKHAAGMPGAEKVGSGIRDIAYCQTALKHMPLGM